MIGLAPGRCRVGELEADSGRLCPAANPIALPELEPRTIGKRRIMPSIRSRDIAGSQGPRVRQRKNTLQPLDIGNGVLGVHPSQYRT